MKATNLEIHELDKQLPGIFSPLDIQFAGFIQNLSGSVSPELVMAARILSSRTADGDVCLNIAGIAGKKIGDVMGADTGSFTLYAENEWLMKLRDNPVVGAPGEYKPMILDGIRLYLYRYWQYEQSIAGNIKERLKLTPDVDHAKLKSGIRRLFSKGDEEQMIAAAGAVLHNFCVISGGPGAGKTSTVIKILSLILESGSKAGIPRIALAAPTGKAAARLNEALKQSDIINDIAGRLGYSIQASTIHRLLGTVHGSPYFRHDSGNPVPYDVVVVDESSMVDIALMAKLFDAVPLASRMILLGDRDQLSSVEAGAVFGDICGTSHSYSQKFIEDIAGLTSIELKDKQTKKKNDAADSIMLLNKSYRFGSESGIGVLGRSIRDNDPDSAVDILRNASYPDVSIIDNQEGDKFMEIVAERVLSGFGAYLKADTAEKAIGSFQDFSILCALRRGPSGVERINSFAEDILHKNRLISKEGPWYRGMPVMILRNDYELKLFNGDTGLILGEGGGKLYFCSRSPDGSIRRILPVQLPGHETAYAMTVHKSQGSEFDHVLLILPDRESPVLTRELLYTAVTRARKKVEIFGSEKIIRAMINNPTKRTSGLREALWK